MKLSPFHVKPDRTMWVDVGTGRMVGDAGPYSTDRTQATRPVTLREVLRLAELEHATRVMLTGPLIARGWLLDAVPGWTHGRHHLDHETPTGRYVHDVADVTVEVRRAAEWFGDGDYSPATARDAWTALGRVLERSGRTGAALFRSPGATGQDLWLRSAGGDVPEPLDDDTQALIRSTSPQHRIDIMPPVHRDIPSLWVLDGRWMYAALTNGLGSGPVTYLRAADADAYSQAHPFARARYLVRFRAPSWWGTDVPHLPGLLMARAGALASDGWHTPLSGEAWVDAAELYAARTYEWSCDVLEGIVFTPGRPLDAWTSQLVRARASVSDDELGADVAALVRGAVRSVLLHAVGSWHSTGADEVTVTDSMMMRPDGDGWDAPEHLENGTALWRRRRTSTNARSLAMRHPEWSSQIWGRAHARMIDCPTSDKLQRAGLMNVPASGIVAVYGDAVMTAVRPSWAALDDGKAGRLRVKGHLCGPMPWPTSAAERDRYTRAAEAAGPICTKGCA